MRRGFRPEWDSTERVVWTAVAAVWAFALAASIIIDAPWEWNLVNQWAGIHALIYALMWLRNMLTKPTGKERDR